MDLYLSFPGSFFSLSFQFWSCKLILRSCSIIPSRCLLAYHFFSVAFYAIWIMFTHARTILSSSPNSHSNGSAKPHSTIPRFNQYPALLVKSARVVSQFISEYLQLSFSEFFVSSSGQLVWCSVHYCGRKYVRRRLRIGLRINWASLSRLFSRSCYYLLLW